MLAIPFGAIGALFGHLIMDITPSYLSVFGILALAGVVVNDSLVMVDFINTKVRAGEDLFESVVQSGTKRFRPILLTSATTFVGLVPLLFDRSLQAQMLIPMATSLAFGILFATAITLYLIPSAYVAAEEAGLYEKQVPARQLYSKMMRTLAQTGNGWVTFKDASNEKCNQTGETNEDGTPRVVHLSNLCTEILEVTDQQNTAVCNLGSLNLGAFFDSNGEFDYAHLGEVVRQVVPLLA
jgi:predicted RND superfamily exporter protein